MRADAELSWGDLSKVRGHTPTEQIVMLGHAVGIEDDSTQAC